MSPVRIGTGAAAVDPSALRLAGQPVSRIMLGTGTGAEQVWPAGLRPLRMVKSGTYTAPANTTSKITGWSPDSTAPYVTAAGDIVGDALVVNGDGTINVSAQITRSSTNYSDQLELYRNGVRVATTNVSDFEYTRTLSWSGTVARGDALDLRYRNTSYYQTSNVTAGYLQYAVA